MKTSSVISIIISILLVACVSVVLFFKFSEIKEYKNIHKNDLIILNCENRDHLVDNLQKLQTTVKEISIRGEAETTNSNLSDQFKSYDKLYDNLAYTVDQISKCQGKFKFIQQDKLTVLNKKNPEIIERLITEQKLWVDEYELFMTDLSSLLNELKPIEEIFYSAKPTDAIQYFNKVNSLFSPLEESHNKYINDLSNYLNTKKELYETIELIAK